MNQKRNRIISIIFFITCLFFVVAPTMRPMTAYGSSVKENEISLSKTAVNVILGDQVKITLHGTEEKVTWSSQNSAVATVESSGMIKGIKKGTTTITAQVDGKSYPCKVVVEQPTLSASGKIGMVGEKTKLLVKDTTKKVAWSSSDQNIATVTKAGVVSFKEEGFVRIIATIGKHQYSCYMTVYVPYNYEHLTKTEKKVQSKMQQILAKNITQNMTTEEKVKFVHDYLLLHTEYDVENYNAGVIPDRSFTEEGVLLYGVAVCQGYADTFQLFMNALGIESRVVVGLAGGGGHAWNMVKLEDGWYHVDCTWDDPIPDEQDRLLYKHFLTSDQEMKELQHRWQESKYPKCNGKKYLENKKQYEREAKEAKDEKIVEEYRKNGRLLSSWEEFASEYARRYRQGETTVSLLFPQENAGTVEDIAHGITKLLGFGYYRYQYRQLEEISKYYLLEITVTYVP